ncbi:hypothetical protein BKA70DRAFT_1579557 [Coprinopsis sp. MPI-PUGE-AT-0042]|nr:hypothetical protein BKA70DRAFT_1579557 [Coprinopsis sp. MPI-PUGE-AT-0042]
MSTQQVPLTHPALVADHHSLHPKPLPKYTACPNCHGPMSEVRCCSGGGSQITNWGRHFQVCSRKVLNASSETRACFFDWLNDPTPYSDIPTSVIEREQLIRSTKDYGPAGPPLGLSCPGKVINGTTVTCPKKANRECRRLPPCCKKCSLSSAPAAAGTPNSTPTTPPGLPPPSQGPRSYARPLDPSYGNHPALQFHRQRQDEANRLASHEEASQALQNRVTVISYTGAGVQRYFVVPRLPGMVIVSVHANVMAGIDDAPVIAVLTHDNSDHSLTWVNQEVDVPIPLPPLIPGAAARIIIRAVDLEDSDCPGLAEESLRYRRSISAIRPSTPPLSVSPSRVLPDDPSHSLPQPQNAASTHPSVQLDALDIKHRAKFPFKYTCDIAAIMVPLLDITDRVDVEYKFKQLVPSNCTFAYSTFQKHRAAFRDGQIYLEREVKDLVAAGRSDDGLWNPFFLSVKDKKAASMTGTYSYVPSVPAPGQPPSPSSLTPPSVPNGSLIPICTHNTPMLRDSDNSTWDMAIDEVVVNRFHRDPEHHEISSIRNVPGTVSALSSPDFQMTISKRFTVTYVTTSVDGSLTNLAVKVIHLSESCNWRSSEEDRQKDQRDAPFHEAVRIFSCFELSAGFMNAALASGVAFHKFTILHPYLIEKEDWSAVAQPYLPSMPSALEGTYPMRGSMDGTTSGAPPGLHDTLSAFSHFTYELNMGKEVHCGFKYAFYAYNNAVFVFDSVTHSIIDDRVCARYIGNEGGVGLGRFIAGHKCNEICQALSLTTL